MKDNNTDITVTIVEDNKSALDNLCTYEDLANLLAKHVVAQMKEDIKEGKYPSFGNVEDWKVAQTKMKLADIERDFE